MYLRNLFYDYSILKSTQFDIPILSVGNLRVGGTGKTPMVEYLVNLLQSDYQVAVLSRGYGRESKGFRLLTSEDKASEVGDESVQLKANFEHIDIAVCENRVEGINKLRLVNPSINLVILDDAFQHRRVLPHIQILLSSYSQPFTKDLPFPSGRLREFRMGVHRSDCLIITKCPDLFPEYNLPNYNKPIFKSTIQYQSTIAKKVYGISALANNQDFKQYLDSNYELQGFNAYSDHYSFNQSDVQEIIANAQGATIVCTEKDWAKLKDLKNTEQFEVIRIVIKFEKPESFNAWLIDKLQEFES